MIPLKGLKGQVFLKPEIHTLSYDADDYQLFFQPGRDEVALKINHKIIEVVNGGAWFLSAVAVIEAFLDSPDLSGFGACDSESVNLVMKILRTIYKET